MWKPWLLRRTDFLEMKLREPNLVFYGVEGEANEGPAESLQKVKSIIKEKMQILESINITKCHRLGKANKSPILISLPEYEDRIKLFKNTTKLRDSKIYINKDYSKKIRDQRLILIAKRKELFEKGTRSKLRDNKLIIEGNFLNEEKPIGFCKNIMDIINHCGLTRLNYRLNYDDIQIELPNILKIKIEQLLQQDLAKLSLTKTYSNYRLLYDSFIPEHYFSCNLSSALVSFIAQIRLISTLIKENHIYVIKKEDLYCRLPLTPPNRRKRLEWCRARSTWMMEWHRVVFSDESRFCLSSDSRRVRVWRRRGERSNPAAIVERPTVRQRGIMVWGAIAYDSRSPLLRIQGTMTAQRYVDDVLRPVTLPYLQGVPNALYQQDNARPHTARISQQALQDVQMLPWPPYSPDLSPIEHVWDIIGRRLHALPQPRSEDELWQMVEREWRAISQNAIRTLIDSLPRRVAACIAVRGDRNELDFEVYINDDKSIYKEIENIKLIEFVNISTATAEQIRQQNCKDQTMQVLVNLIRKGWPKSKYKVPREAMEYWKFRDELTEQDGIIYKGQKVIIPKTLRSELLNRVHASHHGVAASLAKARQAIFWPGMNQSIKETVEKCKACLAYQPNQTRETFMYHETPILPWNKIGMDIFSIETTQYLITVDYYSSFWELDILEHRPSLFIYSTFSYVIQKNASAFVIKTGSTTQWQATDLAPKECIPGLGALTSPDKNIRELIVALSDKMDDWHGKLETKLSSVEQGIEKLDRRIQQLETMMDSTAKSVSMNSEKIREMDARIEFLEMKTRENNLIFHGVEGNEGEDPEESYSTIKQIIADKMQIPEKINILQCRRLSKRARAPLLVSIPDHNERIKLFKNAFKLRNFKIYISKYYTLGIREQHRILIAKRKELLTSGIFAKLRDNKLIVAGKKYQVVNGKFVSPNGVEL
ncbi:hypothetical protein LAZ67_1007025 [Cordylochernes scorpioides]|uniref:RNA-directed DNA polymerase n=1 Tax=Cordylochernes scorpioides TaxID=51811 RepID=A0ABY6JYZ4_9ARAC|nr:hypothetical protein LAZ67_1007025 [Cordylochernes scorpioides]